MVPAVPTVIQSLHNLVNSVCDMTGWLLPSPQAWYLYLSVCQIFFLNRIFVMMYVYMSRML